jgi:hypothetical protein
MLGPLSEPSGAALTLSERVRKLPGLLRQCQSVLQAKRQLTLAAAGFTLAHLDQSKVPSYE